MEIVLAAVVALLTGGLGVEVYRRYSSKKDKTDDLTMTNTAALRQIQMDENSAIRKELREEVVQLRKEIREVDSQLDAWRSKYHELSGRYEATAAELVILREAHFKLMQTYQALLLEVEVLRGLLAKHGMELPLDFLSGQSNIVDTLTRIEEQGREAKEAALKIALDLEESRNRASEVPEEALPGVAADAGARNRLDHEGHAKIAAAGKEKEELDDLDV